MAGIGLGVALTQSVLIAMPQLGDPNFHRAVVLIIEHDAEGSFGLVLNQPLDVTCADLSTELEIPWRSGSTAPLHRGGPVQRDGLWVLHGDTVQTAETVPVLPGVAMSYSKQALIALGARPDVPARVLVGYSGWGPGQLEAEIAQGAWLVTGASAEMIFEWAPEAVWRGALSAVGVDPAFLISGGVGRH